VNIRAHGLRSLRWLVLSLGILWTLPNTLVGFVVGGIGMMFGARASLRHRDLALVFDHWPVWRRGHGGALTLGNVIVHTGASLDCSCVTYAHRAGLANEPRIRLCDHERAHVLQYMALGPLFLPLYFACGGISVRNRFERAADRYALSGSGWWPWG
jgi:hypothetical protein